MSIHRKPDGRYYVAFRDETGKQRTKTFGRGKEAKKETEAFDLELQAARKLGNRPEPRSKIYLDTLAQMYLDDRQLHGASDSYVSDLKNLLNNHVLAILNRKPMDELSYQDLMEVAELYKDRSQATRNRYFVYLRAIFRWGIRQDITKNNPLKSWTKAKEPRKKVQLCVEDLKKIISHAEPHLKWALEVQWNLGTRPGPSELLSLKWQDVDFDKDRVNVYASKTKDWRTIPISPEFRSRLLSKQKEARTEFVIEYQGKPMKKFRRSFQTACKRAGIEYPCRMYDTRHLFASVMLSGGADLAAVSKLLGHSSTQMTANVYYEVLQGEKQKAIALLPPLFNSDENEKASKVVPFKALG